MLAQIVDAVACRVQLFKIPQVSGIAVVILPFVVRFAKYASQVHVFTMFLLMLSLLTRVFKTVKAVTLIMHGNRTSR